MRFDLRASLIAISVFAAVGLLLVVLFLPEPVFSGYSELENIHVGPFDWSNVDLPKAVKEVNEQIALSKQTRARLFVDPGVDINSLSKIGLSLDDVSAAKGAVYLSELNGLRVYSVPEGVIIDYHRDRRSWITKFRDWVKYVLLRKWNGGMSP